MARRARRGRARRCRHNCTECILQIAIFAIAIFAICNLHRASRCKLQVAIVTNNKENNFHTRTTVPTRPPADPDPDPPPPLHDVHVHGELAAHDMAAVLPLLVLALREPPVVVARCAHPCPSFPIPTESIYPSLSQLRLLNTLDLNGVFWFFPGRSGGVMRV